MVENLQEQHPEQGEIIPLMILSMVKYLSMSSQSAKIILILSLVTDFIPTSTFRSVQEFFLVLSFFGLGAVLG
jgi:hypothetical protein